MRGTTGAWFRRLCWLTLLLGALGLGHLTTPSRRADAHTGAVAARPEGETAATKGPYTSVPDQADPWALSPTGSSLDAGYGPGQERPGLLP